MKEGKLQAKEILYGFAIAIAILASTALFTGDHAPVDGQQMQGEVLHSNYILPHAGGGDH